MSKAVSIRLDDESGAFVDRQIAAGRFGTADEVIAAGLQMLRDRDAELDAIRAALIEGEDSGEAAPFDFDAFLDMKRAKRAKSA